MPRSFNQLRLAFALVLMTLALSFSLVTPPAEAATFEVCATCTYTTVSSAVSAAAGSGDASDTILIHPGTYTESATIFITPDQNLIIEALSTDPTQTIIQANAVPDTADYSVFTLAFEGNSVVTIRNLTIRHGSPASSFGGGILNSTNNELTLENVIIRDNSSIAGGGIYNASSLTLHDTHLTNNSVIDANGGGGIFNTTGGTINIYTSTLDNNTTTGNGGAIRNNNGTVNIINSTISVNTASNAITGTGGAIFNDEVATVLTNVQFSTISGNTADGNPGIFNAFSGTSAFTLTNSILTNHGGNDCGGSNITSGTNNLIEGTDCNGTPGRIDAVTNFDTTLADNGGPTPTHALLSLSNAIDGATGCPASNRDQRGAARPSGTDCDIGAIEARPVQTIGTIGGTPLSGVATLSLPSGDVVIEIPTPDDGNGLAYILVEEMGSLHPAATSSIQAAGNNWWRITGDVTSGLNVNVTLPFSGVSGANIESRVCRWPGDRGGAGWDCGDEDNTDFVLNESVTRIGASGFSDWAVGQGAGPTAVTLSQTNAASNPTSFPWLLLSLLTLLTAVGLRLHIRRAALLPATND